MSAARTHETGSTTFRAHSTTFRAHSTTFRAHSTGTPAAGEAVQDVQQRTRGEREGVENKNTQNTQISLNEQKLGAS